MPNNKSSTERLAITESVRGIFSTITKFLLVQTTYGVVGSLKVAASIVDFQNQLLKQGVSYLEKITDNMAGVCPETATTLKEAQKTIQLVVGQDEKKQRETKEDTNELHSSDPGLIKSGVRMVFSRFPGKQLLKVFDLAITITEKSLDLMDPSPHVKQSKDKSQQTEPTDKPKDQQSKEVKKESLEQSKEKDVEKNQAVQPRRRGIIATLGTLFVFPLRITLKLWMSILKPLQCYIHEATNVDKGTSTSSPQKRRRLTVRRNVTPQKTPVLHKITDRILKAVGLSNVEEERVRHEKRKREDVADSEESENEMNLDEVMHNYDSEMDPDYSITADQDYASTDSLEYKSGDTESDIEIESKEVNGKVVEQIKEKEDTSVESKKEEKKDNKSDPSVNEQKINELKKEEENDENKSPSKKKVTKILLEEKASKLNSPEKKLPKVSTPDKNKGAKQAAKKVEDNILSPKNQGNDGNIVLKPVWQKAPKK